MLQWRMVGEQSSSFISGLKKKKKEKKEYRSTHTHKNEAKEQAKLLSSGRPSALEQFLEELMPPAVTPTSAALLVRLPYNDESD